MAEFLVLLSIIFFISVGFFVIKILNLLPMFSNIEIVPYAFGLGSGIIAYELYLISRMGFSWNIFLIIIPWILISIIVLLVKPKKLNFKFKFKIKFSKKDKILLLLITATMFFVLFEAWLRPLSAWDGWSIWLLKAKIFFLDKKINPSVLSYVNSDYPLIMSLMSSFIYLVLGSVNDRIVLLLFSAFYFFLGWIFFFSLKKYIGITWALFFTFLLISTQNLIRQGGRYEVGNVDLALGFYFFISTLLLINFIKSKNLKVLIILNLFLVITSLVKNEGMPFSILIQFITIFYIIKYKLYSRLMAVLLWIIPFVDWQIFQNIYKVPRNFLLTDSSFKIERIGLITNGILREFVNIQNWNLLWLIFILVFLYYLISKKREKLNIFFIILFFQLILYFLIYMVTPINPIVHIKSSLDRLLIQLAPLAVFTTSLVILNKEV